MGVNAQADAPRVDVLGTAALDTSEARTVKPEISTGHTHPFHDEDAMRNEWQPIETAPKAGSEDILVYVPHHQECFVAWWGRKEQQWLWYDVDVKRYCTPTHWQPLPEPPTP